MIIQKEILKISKNLGIQSFVLDKDWVLGHFLNAMFDFEEVKENFVFKGGTCLKKCYFPDYRFSEDLDFTLLDKSLKIDKKFFDRIIIDAEKNSGANFHLKEIKSQIYRDIPQGYEITILFWGADHKPNQKPLPVNRWKTKIKLDISFSEKIILKPEFKSIFHLFSDSKIIRNKVPVYPINEIAAEKLRSLLQRNRPRDIYDLYYLSSIIKREQYPEIIVLLQQKAQNKDVNCCKYDDFINENKHKKNKRAWESSLQHHLPQEKLIDYDTAYSTTEKFVKNILKLNEIRKYIKNNPKKWQDDEYYK